MYTVIIWSWTFYNYKFHWLNIINNAWLAIKFRIQLRNQFKLILVNSGSSKNLLTSLIGADELVNIFAHANMLPCFPQLNWPSDCRTCGHWKSRQISSAQFVPGIDSTDGCGPLPVSLTHTDLSPLGPWAQLHIDREDGSANWASLFNRYLINYKFFAWNLVKYCQFADYF